MTISPLKFLQRYKLNITVISLYLVFTLIFTFPLIYDASALGNADAFPTLASGIPIPEASSKHIGLAIFVFFNTEVYLGTTGMDRISE